MKRIVLLVSAFVLLSGLVNAQVQLALGLKGGLNFARVNAHSTVTQDYGTRTGYHIGGYAMIKIVKFAIQPEVIFSKQGQSFSYSQPGQKLTNLYSDFTYLNIPIMLKLYLAAGFNLQAGPQFGFLAAAGGNAIDASGTMIKQDTKSLIKSSDMSIGFGFGWDLPLGINIGARYNLGLSDINKYSGQSNTPSGTVTSIGTVQAKNQVIQISVGYRLFKLGK